jgi:hypothetical protein
MFIKDWVRTLLIWAGLILFWSLNILATQHGEPYITTIDGELYMVQDPIINWEPYWFLFTLAMAFNMTGCYIWTKLKNRSWAFMFWGLLTSIGLLGISLLQNKSIGIGLDNAVVQK